MSDFVSLKQISEELGIPMKTVYLYRNRGLFPTYKFGKHYRVSVEDFEAFKARALLDVFTLMEMGL
jgi:excisionase family DNA binding protein